MTQVVLNVSDELAALLRGHESDIAGILADVMRRRRDPACAGFEDAIMRLAAARSADEVLALKPGPELETRVAELREKSRAFDLNPDEQAEWERYELLEHFMRLAKARALQKRQVKS